MIPDITASVTLSETHSPPNNSKSELDILCALLQTAVKVGRVKQFTQCHIIKTTSCCSAGGKEEGEAVRLEERQGGRGEMEETAYLEREGSQHLSETDKLICQHNI